MVQPNRINALNGSFGIGIGGQQHFACLGVKHPRLGQKLRTAHGRHTLVGQKQGNWRIAAFKLAHCFQRFLA